jgi:hypothetical protein
MIPTSSAFCASASVTGRVVPTATNASRTVSSDSSPWNRSSGASRDAQGIAIGSPWLTAIRTRSMLRPE